jgi:23S rRNA pseudouridine1911/1915/1917 synthase
MGGRLQELARRVTTHEDSALQGFVPRRLRHVVTEDEDGRTVASVCRSALHLTDHAISHAKFLEDGIMLDGRRVFTREAVHPGQVLAVTVGDSEQALSSSRVVPRAGALDVVYEDDDVIVIDKPAGLVMHPGPGHFDDTLANRLLAHYRSEGERANFHAVHRLDVGTSGLVVVAKNPHAQDRLQRMLHTPDFERTYVGMAEAACLEECSAAAGGGPGMRIPELSCGEEGRIDAPIGAVSGALDTYSVTDGGKQACTCYEVIGLGEGCRLLRFRLMTGRTHQIRVHMAATGHPLVGDVRYGHASELIARPALHAARVSLLHPVTGLSLEFTSPLPDDMRALLGSTPEACDSHQAG